MSRQIQCLTFVCGGDDYLVSRMGKTLFEEGLDDTTNDFNREIVDGCAANVSEVSKAVGEFRQAVITMPLFGGKKSVWFKDVTFLSDSALGRAQETLDQVEALREVLSTLDGEAVRVLITAFPVDRRRAFAKWCEKNGEFVLASGDGNYEQTLPALIRDECATLAVSIRDAAAELLVAKLSANTRLVIEELRKLATFLGGEDGVIEEKHVADLVPDFGESEFFETAEAFYSLDLEWTLDAIRRHFFIHRDARGLISMLQGRNRLLIQLRVLLDAGKIPLSSRGLSKSALGVAAQCYGHYFDGVDGRSNFNLFTQNPWYLGRLSGIAKKVPLKRLIDFQTAFLAAFEEIIARPGEHEQVMQKLAVRCIS